MLASCSPVFFDQSSFAKPPLKPTFAAMFEKLRKKWKVGGWQLLLILFTFAFGGSITGYLGRKAMHFLDIDDGWFFLPVYIIIITILWPLMVLIISIPLGQYRFFAAYLRKIGLKMGIIKSNN
jgi:hypothetical protein